MSNDKKQGDSSTIRELASATNSKLFGGMLPGERGARVSEADAFIGLKLHYDDRDVASAERAHVRALEVLQAEKNVTDQLDWLPAEILFAARQYWAEHERDDRIVQSEMKKEVCLLQADLTKVLERLKRIPSTTREVLNMNASAIFRKRSTREFVQELESVSALIHDACISISSKKNVRPRRSFRFETCAATLVTIRERIVKTPISHVIDLRGNTFTTSDSAFICAVMQAIDEKVTPSKVQDGLRRAVQAKNSRK